jgi:uncharacterized protein (TIGR03437 family)
MLRFLFAFLCAAAACFLVASALSSAQSPGSSAPDPFVAQITHAPAGRDVSAGDTTANGRFVVVESDGDIATEKVPTFNASGTPNPDPRNNEDGNREIFLFDYAQRRVFQLTNTKSVLKPASSPSPSPSPSASPSPTASPTPTPVDPRNVAIEINNVQPMITLQPALIGGLRTYTIVFNSNAPVTPAFFNGTDPGAPTNTDMNQEIWTYQFTVADTLDLTTGAEVGPIDLTTGTFTRITNTPASRAPSPANSPSPGNPQLSAFVADDNRDATISDNGNLIAFISNRDIVAGGNTDAGSIPNPEVFLFNRTSAAFTQVTNTITTSVANPIFSANPALSSDGGVLAFVSNANLTAANADGNAEVYLREGATLRQVTKTKDPVDSQGHALATATVFSYGRRLSRDGKFLVFETVANDPGADGANSNFRASFVYNVTANTFAQVSPRATEFPGDVGQFPTFTDYDASLNPTSVIFTSFLNIKTDGTLLAAADAAGLNPQKTLQLFLAPLPPPLPAAPTGPFTRLTNTTGPAGAGLRGLPSESRRRIAFSLQGAELGGGNSDSSKELFYQLSPQVTTESGGSIALFTGASLVPVASPTASPVPSPTGSPFVAPGLAAGELAVAQFTLTPAPIPASVSLTSASEARRAPALPVELNGLSMSINGAACGLYSVTATSVSFVVPIGLAASSGTTSYPVVINNKGTVIRGQLTIVGTQPDIFTSTNGPGGRAVICNITNPTIATCVIEPFNVTTPDSSGTVVPTVLEIHLTGIRGVTASTINVTIGTTVIVPSAAFSLDQPGFDVIDLTLPATVDRGDLPVVVKVGTATSRPADSAPKVTINP